MAISSDLQTRITISAQDRGASALLRRLGGEADASVREFSRLGDAIRGVVGGIGAGLAIKKVSDWIEEFKMTTLSVATMLTDTMRDSGMAMDEVFDQNRRHAEEFYRVLQQQSAKSLSSMDDLMSAYTMLANYGRSLSPTARNAQLLANVVDRIRLATKGQNQEIQVMQELRAMMSGQARPSDALARMLRQRDADFSKTLGTMVSGGASAEEILEYVNSLLSDVDMGKYLSASLGKSLEQLRGNFKLWAIDSFGDLHTEAARAVSGIAQELDPTSAGSPLRRSLDGLRDGFRQVFDDVGGLVSVIAEPLSALGPSILGVARGLATDFLPRLAAAAVSVGAMVKGFAQMRALAAAVARTSLTLPAIVAAAYGTFAAVEAMKDTARPNSVTDYSELGRAHDWEWVKSYVVDTFMMIKAAFVAAATEIYNLAAGFFSMLAGRVLETIGAAFGWASELPSLLSGWVEAVFDFDDRLSRWLESMAHVAEHAFDMVVYNFRALGVMLHNGFIDAVNGVVTSIAKAVDDLASKVVATFAGMADALQGALSGLTFGSYVPRRFPRYQPSGDYSSLTIGESRKLEYPRRPQATSYTPAATAEAERARREAQRERARELTEMMRGWLGPMAESLSSLGVGVSGFASGRLEDAMSGKAWGQFLSLWSEERREWARGYAERAGRSNGAGGSAEAVTGAQRTVMDINESQLRMVNSMSGEIDRLVRQIGTTGDALSKMDVQIESAGGKSGEYAEAIASMDREIDQLSRSVGIAGDGYGLLSSETDRLLSRYRELREELQTSQSDYQRRRLDGQDTEETVKRINSALKSLFEVIGSLVPSLKAEGESLRSEAAKRIDRLRVAQSADRSYNETMRGLSGMGEAGGLVAGLTAFGHDTDTSRFREAFTVATETVNAFSGSVSDAIYNLMTEGSAKIRDVVVAFGQSVIRSISDSLARSLTDLLAESLASLGAKLLGLSVTTGAAAEAQRASAMSVVQGFGAASASSRALSAAMVSATTAIASAASALSGTAIAGGVLSGIGGAAGGLSASWMGSSASAAGGFSASWLPAFASGGLVTSPMLAMVGEAGQNEAIVPLPDGRSIPVTLSGSGAGVSVTVNVVNNAGVGVETQRRETDDGTVIDIILDAANRNRRGFRSGMRSALGVGK